MIKTSITLAIAGVFAISLPQLSVAQSNAQELTEYDAMQAVRFEVQELSGKIEELNYEIEQLKKQRIQDFLNLDRRLNELAQRDSSQVSVPTASYTTATASNNETESIVDSIAQDESITENPSDTQTTTQSISTEKQYQQATNLLRNKQVDLALEVFNKIQTDEPQSKHAANSLFWMGKIYQIKKQNELARQQYVQFIDRFPNHRKTNEVAYFLGKLYFDLGDIQRSRELMDTALKSVNPKVSVLATRFIEKNFPAPVETNSTPTTTLDSDTLESNTSVISLLNTAENAAADL